MTVARLYARGQITLPKKTRELLGVTPGDSVVIEDRDGEAVIRKPRGILEADGLGAPKRPVEDLDKLHAVARSERVKKRLAR